MQTGLKAAQPLQHVALELLLGVSVKRQRSPASASSWSCDYRDPCRRKKRRETDVNSVKDKLACQLGVDDGNVNETIKLIAENKRST